MPWPDKLATAGAILANIAAVGAVGAGIKAGVPYAVKRLMGKEPDEKKDRNPVTTFLWEAARAGASLAYGGDKIVSAIQSAVTGKGGADSLMDLPVERTVRQGVYDGIGNLARGAIKAAKAEDSADQEKAVDQLLKGLENVTLAGTTLMGLPVAPLYLMGKRVYRATQAEATGVRPRRHRRDRDDPLGDYPL